jgi:hypothetical protein
MVKIKGSGSGATSRRRGGQCLRRFTVPVNNDVVPHDREFDNHDLSKTLDGLRLHEAAMYLESQAEFGEIPWPR